MADSGTITPMDAAPLSFGIFDWLDRGPVDLADLYEQRLQMLEYADKAGYYCYHLAEHHATPLNMAPSPGLFLAAVAQRTHRIHLGPLVYLLPLYNPVRLIEEICMLDHLSQGRLELGVGRGISPHELAAFNVDIQESRAIFHEALDLILTGLATGEVSHEGRYFSFRNVRLPLRPLQQPYPPLWYPTSNPESLSWVAREGLNIVNHYSPLPEMREQFALYKQFWQENRDRPDRLNRHVTDPKIGIMRHIYVAETDEQARREAKAAFTDHFASFTYLWVLHGDIHRHDHIANFDASLEKGLHFVGSPATVRAQIKQQVEITGCNYILGAFAFGSLTIEQIMNSLRLFAEEVMPAFRRAPTTV